jgi:phosphatidylserine/phosphatidylglycerophosphate/cardiolipin synthase-like enzyme
MPDGTRVRTLFAPDYDVARYMVNELRQAEKSIYFMAFSFTHEGIGSIMKKRFQDGLDVRGVFESRGADSPHSEYASMQKLGMTVIKDTNKWSMHHKVIIIDGKTVITGSFNFSNNAARINEENALIIQGNREIAALYTKEWQGVMGIPSDTSLPSAASVPQSELKPASDAAVASAGDITAGSLNVNTATQQQLEALPGIGPELARRIIAGRPYRQLPDLERVRGLGPSKLEALRGLVGFE